MEHDGLIWHGVKWLASHRHTTTPLQSTWPSGLCRRWRWPPTWSQAETCQASSRMASITPHCHGRWSSHLESPLNSYGFCWGVSVHCQLHQLPKYVLMMCFSDGPFFWNNKSIYRPQLSILRTLWTSFNEPMLVHSYLLIVGTSLIGQK